MTAVWIPPEDFSETVIFVGTVVKDKATFWEHQHSAPLQLGSLIGLDEKETLKPEDHEQDSVTTDVMEKEKKSSTGGKMMMSTTTMPSKMGDSQFSKTNFTETVASVKASASITASTVFNLIVAFVIAVIQMFGV